MYLEYFSLKKFPFRITPDPSLFFPGGADGRGVVLDALIYAITTGEGILKVVGEVGSGKTMLCRMLGGKLSDSVEIVYLANPNLSARDIIFAIAFELDLDVDSNTDRLLAMHKLQAYLLKKHSEGGTVVVFIEEAQSMPLEALEEIRLLSNLETHQYKLMQIVLFGQPELDKKLRKKSIRQLRERITHSFNLEPLSVVSTGEYLRFRLQAAGCPWPQLFSPQAEKKLAKAATGLTRRINILADKALMAAYADPATQKDPRNSAGQIQSMVLPRHVKAAIRDCGYGNQFVSLLGYAGLGFAAILVVGISANYIKGAGFFREEVAEVLEPQNIESSNVAIVELVENAREQEIVVTLDIEPEIEVSVAIVEVIEVIEVVEVLPEPVIEVDQEIVVEIVIEPEPEPVIEIVEVETETVDSPEVLLLDELITGSVEIDEAPVRFDDTGLVALRERATREWLQDIPAEAIYTLQLISISTSNRSSLEEFLQFFSVIGLLEKTYVCTISETQRGPEQWLVLHGEFTGVTSARNYIDRMPEHLRRYEPYIRNTSGIACKP